MSYFRAIVDLVNQLPHQTNPRVEQSLKEIGERLGLTEEFPNVVGAFGDVVFEASSIKIETLKDLKRKMRARYATHDVVGQKSVLEFVGLEPDEITFTMQLNADLGVNINRELEKLFAMLRSGESNYLILGASAYGQYQWVITDLSIDHRYADRQGNPYFAEVDITLKEVLP